MKRLLIILGLLLALPTLLIAAVFLWLKSMDPDLLRSQLEAALERATGREVTICRPTAGDPAAPALGDSEPGRDRERPLGARAEDCSRSSA